LYLVQEVDNANSAGCNQSLHPWRLDLTTAIRSGIESLGKKRAAIVAEK
jgi:hypothetical protein